MRLAPPPPPAASSVTAPSPVLNLAKTAPRRHRLDATAEEPHSGAARVLPLLGSDRFDFGRKLPVSGRIDGPVLDGSRRRIFPQEVLAFPVLPRPYRTRGKSAATIRAHVTKQSAGAGFAEG